MQSSNSEANEEVHHPHWDPPTDTLTSADDSHKVEEPVTGSAADNVKNPNKDGDRYRKTVRYVAKSAWKCLANRLSRFKFWKTKAKTNPTGEDNPEIIQDETFPERIGFRKNFKIVLKHSSRVFLLFSLLLHIIIIIISSSVEKFKFTFLLDEEDTKDKFCSSGDTERLLISLSNFPFKCLELLCTQRIFEVMMLAIFLGISYTVGALVSEFHKKRSRIYANVPFKDEGSLMFIHPYRASVLYTCFLYGGIFAIKNRDCFKSSKDQ